MILYQYPPQAGVTISTPPIEFVLDGVATQVTEDTAAPLNNTTMPVHSFIIEDGVQQPINIDTVATANNRPMPSGMYVQDWTTGDYLPVVLDNSGGSNNRAVPVKITDFTGGNINITAGDINVSLSDMAPNFDRTRIGDGSGAQATFTTEYIPVVGSWAMKTHDDILANASIEPNNAIPDLAIMVGAEDGSGNLQTLKQSGNDLLTSSLTRFTLDAASQIVIRDTATPANSRPLPVIQLDSNGNPAGVASLNYGVSTAALRTAAQIGNTAGQADFDTGVSTAQTLRTVLATRHEAVATPVSIRKGNGVAFDDYDDGVSSANTPRVSANIKFEGVDPDLNTGAATVATLRTVLATRHETVTTPIATRLSNGTDWNAQTAPAWARLSDGTDPIIASAVAAAQLTQASVTKALQVISTLLGWDGTTHRELSVTDTGVLNTKSRASGTSGSMLKGSVTSGNTTTLTAPANAVGFILKCGGESDGTMCWEIGGVATATSMDFAGGQSTSYVPCAANVSLFANGGDIDYSIQWFIA